MWRVSVQPPLSSAFDRDCCPPTPYRNLYTQLIHSCIEAREATTAQEILREIEEAGLEASEDTVGEVVGLSDVDVDVGEEGVGESSQKEAEGGEDGEKTDGIGEERVEMEKVLDDLDLSEEGEFQFTDEGLDDGGPENDGFN